MVSVEKLYKSLQVHGVDFFTGVPDSLLKDFCAYVTDHCPRERNIIAANEGTAVGIAAGHYMVSGRLPLVYMQNSGLGNTVNPLLSLMDEKVYALPVVLMIGWRGEPGVKDEPQHVKQGEVTLALLEAMQIPYVVLSDQEEEALQQTGVILQKAKEENRPHAIVIRKGIFGKYQLQCKIRNNYPLSREEALKLVVDQLGEKDVVVSTTGKLSRELFEYREALQQGHGRDFLTVGSMGHSSSIALGIALEKRERTVWCLDGDGAFIMHMGAISNIGSLSPKNYRHIIFNNGAHESVGGQPTVGFQLDIQAIARACGYPAVYSVSTSEEIKQTLRALSGVDGPALVEIRVKIASREDLGRPTAAPIDNRRVFMDFLENE